MKPMLAYKCPKTMSMDKFLSELTFPLLATPKIDGIRCLTSYPHAAYPHATSHLCNPHTRSLKDIPNRYVRGKIASYCPPWLDGELTCGNSFQAVTSGIMTHEGEPEFTYWVFDCNIHTYAVYGQRVSYLRDFLPLPPFCKKLLPITCFTREQLFAYEAECLEEGAEGVMVRPPDSPYICGRASKTKPYLVAIKRFEDSEAVIVGFNQRMHNMNDPERNALGLSERSSHKDRMFPMQSLGSFQAIDIKSQESFSVGTGFDRAFADYVWRNQPQFMGKILKYRYQLHGVKDAPRIPSFLGMRDESDMS